MSKYITFLIDTLEDIKQARTSAKGSAEASMDYITGSSVRGAYIYKYISKFHLSDINQGVHKDKLLKGGITFLNAYPATGTDRSVPFPKCYFATKDSIRSFEREMVIISGFCLPAGQVFENVRLADFVQIEDNVFKMVKVKKKANLHINKSTLKNKLFRYEAIEKGQTFKGIIKVEDEKYVDEVIELLDNANIYIGGSKGSGYGKCRFHDFEIVEENPEYTQLAKRSGHNGSSLYLLALSDIIYRTELGEYKTIIDAELIRNSLGLEDVCYEDSMIETKDITAFNNKWGCNLPQVMGIKAGSIYKYGFKGSINQERLADFINNGLGERKSDGFGRFVILDSITNSVLKKENHHQKLEIDLKTLLSDMSKAEKDQAKRILTGIYMTRFENGINERVLELYKKLRNPKAMHDSQWGFYLNLFSCLQYKTPAEGIKIFNENMKKIESKRSKSFKQIDNVYIDNKKLLEFLCDYINYSDPESFLKMNPVDIIRLGDVTPEIDNEFAYRIKMKTLTELCRYHIRKEMTNNEENSDNQSGN